jgi:probable F420-dependent oxidoreductase
MTDLKISAWQGNARLDEHRLAKFVDLATELDALGYTRLWIGAGFGAGVPDGYRALLDATPRLGLASGIVSIWHASPQEASAAVAELEAAYPGRFLLGLGASHAPVVESELGPDGGTPYKRPYSKMVEYLDALDAVPGDDGPPAGAPHRALAALGPKMLELARDRSAGAHPYFVPAEHTAKARAVLGPDRLLATEVAVVVEPDRERALKIARQYAAGYLQLPNYTQNLRTFGYGDDDLRDDGSERLIDAVIPSGELETVVAGLRRHADAGADELAIQVLTDQGHDMRINIYRALAGALLT